MSLMVNYFDLFELPQALELDKAALTQKYYALNKLYHPDKFTLSSEAEQTEALEMSSKVNEGYKLLRKKQSRIHHLLELHNAAPQEGQTSMPQDFLMEMMDVNEAIMDYKMDPSEEGKNQVEVLLSRFEEELEAQLSELQQDLDFAAPAPEKLEILKDYFLKSKYLRRLKDNLADRTTEI